MIDTHCHLDACADLPETLLARARETGVERVVTVATGIESARRALELARVERGVHVAVGVHPHEAAGPDGTRLPALQELLKQERVVAVGETGLDFFRDYAPRDAQRRLFEAQLDLANTLGLPVVIHSRSAAAETAEVLAAFPGTVILHCFSEPELLGAAVDRGYYVSFAGNLTYPKAQELRSAAAVVPEERLLVETDCPYLPPQPMRGRPNEPAYLIHTLRALADVRGVDARTLEARIDLNADRAFDLR